MLTDSRDWQVLWADHGWALGENNEWGKHTAFRHANHVPLLFRLPSRDGSAAAAAARALDSYAENVDIFPTMADLAGITVPPRCSTEAESQTLALCTEGVSLAPLIVAAEQPTATAGHLDRRDRDSSSTHSLALSPPRAKVASFWQ